jgi:predicted metal-dependent hydrolase
LTDAPPEPTLSPEDQALFERGLHEFNTGFFFECHETLEDVWHGVRGPSRDFFQGIIQLAVACYHLTRGNTEGAGRLFDRGLARLSRYPERYGGLELEALRAEARALRARVPTIESVELADLPKVRRVSAG